jgi:hypothetical protein
MGELSRQNSMRDIYQLDRATQAQNRRHPQYRRLRDRKAKVPKLPSLTKGVLTR